MEKFSFINCSDAHYMGDFLCSDYIEAEHVIERLIALIIEKKINHRLDLFDLRLVLHEAIGNALHHGNHLNSNKHVKVSMAVESTRLLLEIKDEGKGFDYQKVMSKLDFPDSHISSGRGILLMKGLGFYPKFWDCGNVLTLEKTLL